jgi:hypothetical protein
MTIEPGMVIWLHFPYLRPQAKYKFAVLGSIEPKLQFVFINSVVNPFMNIEAARKAHHLPVSHLDHTFLTRDSWMDCSYPVGYDLDSLCQQLKNNVARIVGAISDDLRSTAIECIDSSVLWPRAKSQPFVDGLTWGQPFEF